LSHLKMYFSRFFSYGCCLRRLALVREGKAKGWLSGTASLRESL
jgi:hypothetical protein